MVVGSSGKLFNAEELPKPVEFRSQGAYLQFLVSKNEFCEEIRKVISWFGSDCTNALKSATLILGAQLAFSRNAEFISTPKELNSQALNELIDIDKSNIQFLTLENSFKKMYAPRIFRIYGNESEELIFERYDKEINFTYRQTDLRFKIFF